MNRTKHRLSEREKKDSSKNSFKQQQQRRPPPQRQQLDTCAADSLAERDISKAASATDDATPDARSIEVSLQKNSPVKKRRFPVKLCEEWELFEACVCGEGCVCKAWASRS